MPRTAKEIKCNESDISSLKSIVANPLSDHRLVTKATALLLCISGMDNKDVASELGVRKNTIGDWRKAFIDGGIEGLKGKKRPGRRGNNAPNMRELVKEKLNEKPADGKDWTAKSLSEAVGTSVDTVRRVLREEGVTLERRSRWSVPVEAFPSLEEGSATRQGDMFSDPAVNNVLRVSATILGRDGREIHREAEIPNGVPGLGEIDYGSPLALGASVGKVERAISGGMSGVAKGLCEEYINAALKKTEHPEKG